MSTGPVTSAAKTATHTYKSMMSGPSQACHDSELRAMLDILPVGAMQLDRKGHCTFLNRVFIDLFEYTLDEVVDLEQWFFRVCPDPAVHGLTVGRSVQQPCGSTPFPVQLNITCKNGDVKQVMCAARSAVNTTIVTFTDITAFAQSSGSRGGAVEERQAEQSLNEKSLLLKKTNEHLESRITRAAEELRQKDDVLASQNRLLVDLAPEAIIVYDTQSNRIIDANARAEQLFECSREILLTSSPLQFYMDKQPDGRSPEATFHNNADRVMAGEVLVLERAIKSTHGVEVMCEVRLVRLPSPDKLLIRASFFDITERMHTHKELAKALDAEYRLNEEQRQFMGLVSHELRTPLSIIDGRAHLLLLNTCKDPDCLKHAKGILSSTNRLTRLIDTCLTEERLCTSGWAPASVPADIGQLVRNVVTQAQGGTDRHQIRHDLEDCPEQYSCDPTLIQVMLNNLIDNAIKYSPDGGEIHIRSWHTEGELFFEVTDQGVGIPPDQLDKAFDRFYRIWQIPGIAGAGLGLHIVKRIAELHGGGTVSCSSEPGQGSTFMVRLCSAGGSQATGTPIPSFSPS